jgi:hypothetical protein
MENNFTIDYAKTLFKPVRPDIINAQIMAITSQKLPQLFVYAKDKEVEQTEPINNSVVNQLEALVPNKRLDFKDMGYFDYRMLMVPDYQHDISDCISAAL